MKVSVYTRESCKKTNLAVFIDQVYVCRSSISVCISFNVLLKVGNGGRLRRLSAEEATTVI